jgi:transposase
MRHVREILRLDFAGTSKHEIARRTGLAASTVRETLKRFAVTELGWPLPDDVTDGALEALLYKNAGTKQGHRRQVEPDWVAIHRELKRKHVTLQILWDEYIEQHPDGYRYSRFCDLFRAWEGKLSVTMRQPHAGGEKMFVDYAGDRATVVIDRLTGEVREAWIFVAVLGASNFTYAEATWTQGLADWIGAHTRAFEAIGGVPRLVVPDNTKTAVIKACLYEPSVNRTYTEMAGHYDTAILPTRPRKPRDKAKVEAGVRFAQTYVLGRLRHLTFFSLAECNVAITQVLERLNGRVMRRLGMSRRELFDAIERPALNPLPPSEYEYAEWHFARVGLDYHVEVTGFFYSVPHPLLREQVDTRLTAFTVEVFHRGKRVAAHARRHGGPRHGTDPNHMPSAHRRYAEWNPERFCRQARGIGPNTEALIIAVLAQRPHPEQGFRSCLGMLRLFRGIDAARAETVSAHALEIGALSY